MKYIKYAEGECLVTETSCEIIKNKTCDKNKQRWNLKFVFFNIKTKYMCIYINQKQYFLRLNNIPGFS